MPKILRKGDKVSWKRHSGEAHALAHQDKIAVRAIYNRGSYWTARAELMQWWSDIWMP